MKLIFFIDSLMKVLLTGSNGQLGRSIIDTKPKNIDLIVTYKEQLDLSKISSCEKLIIKEKPDWVINCAAFTAVDKAEENIDLSNLINGYALRAFTNAINKTNGKLLHISTDFVFDGKQNFPYRTNQKTNPINQYGYSKALGERLIEKESKGFNNAKILRTSWVLSPYGNNFALKMLNLHEEKEQIKVVTDQIGTPTSAKYLAITCWKIINYKETEKLPQIMHWCDSGVASWFDIAIAVGEIGLELGIIKKKAIIYPIKSKDYRLPANRPKYSILDTEITSNILKLRPNHWRMNLFEILTKFKKNH